MRLISGDIIRYNLKVVSFVLNAINQNRHQLRIIIFMINNTNFVPKI